MISKDELDNLKKHIGQYISISSFFSTSIRQNVASFYMGDGVISNDLQRVFFEIDISQCSHTDTLFADINEQSKFPNELEILFMIGFIFHLVSVDLNEKDVYSIRMTLCTNTEKENELKQVFDQLKSQNPNQEITLRTLAKLLYQMGKSDLAIQYYNDLLGQLSHDDPLRLNVYEDLADIALRKGDLDENISWQKKILSLKSILSANEHQTTSSLQTNKKRKVYSTGDEYEGEFVNGLFHGYGVYKWKNGDRYEGMWEKNRRKGHGKWT